MSASRQARYWEPEPRFGACSATVGRKQYIWGGGFSGGVFAPTNTVLILDLATSLWTEQQLSGPYPPGVAYPACAIIGHSLFIFGGWTEKGYSNSMYKLGTTTLKFSVVKATNIEVSPIPKLSVMIPLSTNILLVVCGYGIPIQKRSTGLFIKERGSTDGCGYTNEVHCFTLDGGKRGGT